jgi:hypothetical protein
VGREKQKGRGGSGAAVGAEGATQGNGRERRRGRRARAQRQFGIRGMRSAIPSRREARGGSGEPQEGRDGGKN